MLSCRELTELATAYLEADLPWHVRWRVRAHLWMCVHCRRYIEQLRTVVELLRRLPGEPVPPQLIEALLPHFQEARKKPD